MDEHGFTSAVFLGIAITLTIYHFFIWWGRKKDLSNLAYAFLAFSHFCLLAGFFLSAILYMKSIEIIGLAVSCNLLCLSFPFLISVVFPREKNLVAADRIGQGIITGCTLLAIVHYTLTGSTLVINGILLIIIGLFGIYGLISTALDKKIKRALKKKEYKIFNFAFRFMFCCYIFLCILTAFFKTFFVRFNFIFFNLPFLIMMFIFAYGLARRFNREHHALAALKTDLEKKVQQRTRQLKAAHTEKINFFMNLAHETKTPLTLISNYIAEYGKEHNTDLTLQIAIQNIEKLKQDMVNFLDFAKLENNQPFYSHDRILDFSNLLSMKTLLYRELAAQKKITLLTEIEEHVCARIDPAAGERIINNLLENALKFTPAGGAVTVHLRAEPAYIIFIVKDSGAGIAGDKQSRIFKPYYQISHEKGNLEGMGLGLSIVKTIVKQLHGGIRLESSPEKGSTFTVELPAAVPAPGETVQTIFDLKPLSLLPAQITLMPEIYDKNKPTLFVVEDNKALIYYLQQKLTTAYNLFYALSGNQALDKIRNIPGTQVIISDVLMDDGDGFTFYANLVKEEQYRAVPFLFLTALASFPDKIRALQKGAVDYIYKPFSIMELETKLNALVKVQNALSWQQVLTLSRRLEQYLTAKKIAPGKLFDPAPEPASAACTGVTDALPPEDEYTLSLRQLEITALLKTGFEYKEIAGLLGISINTVKTQLKRVYRKCAINNKVELINLLN